MENQEKILIIGGGEIGRAIKHLLDSAESVTVFDKDPERSDTERKLEDLIAESSMIFLAVKTRSIKDLTETIQHNLTEKSLVITLSKGLSEDRCVSVEVLAEVVSDENLVAMSGPMIAEEIMANKMSYAEVASKNQEATERVTNLFKNNNLDTTVSEDVIGVALAGVSKNIYTIGVAIAEGLDLGANTRGILISEAVKEMGKIIYFFKGESATALWLAGLSDLVTTSSSEHSQNKRVGLDIAKNGETDKDSEGLHALPLLIQRLDKEIDNLPFLKVISRVIVDKENPEDVFSQYIQKIY